MDIKAHILVMDDDEDVLAITSLLLVKYGYRVEKCSNGTEALALYEQALAKEHPFDLVVSDLSVADGMGGIELLNNLLKIDPAPKVLLMSGYSDDPQLSNLD